MVSCFFVPLIRYHSDSFCPTIVVRFCWLWNGEWFFLPIPGLSFLQIGSAGLDAEFEPLCSSLLLDLFKFQIIFTGFIGSSATKNHLPVD